MNPNLIHQKIRTKTLRTNDSDFKQSVKEKTFKYHFNSLVESS